MGFAWPCATRRWPTNSWCPSWLAVAFAQRSWVDFGLLLVATALVLAAELLNTAIEELCDYVQPDRAPQIGATKDIAAAAVGLCIVAWMGVMVLEAWRLLFSGRS